MAANSKRFEHNRVGESMLTSKPSKQRRMMHQAPDHMRYKMFGAPLSDALVASQGVKTLPVRSGDTVRVMRGDHKGFEGKITRVNRRDYRIHLEGLTREKTDGTTIFVALHPSKVMITNLNLDDKWRKKIIERKKAVIEKRGKKKPARRKVPEKAIEAEAPQPEARRAEVEEKVVAKEVTVAVKKEPKKKVVRRRRRTAKKPAAKEEPAKKAEEEKPKAKPKRTRSKRETAGKREGGE
jgi:large subunit ribosomal protein L24